MQGCCSDSRWWSYFVDWWGEGEFILCGRSLLPDSDVAPAIIQLHRSFSLPGCRCWRRKKANLTLPAFPLSPPPHTPLSPSRSHPSLPLVWLPALWRLEYYSARCTGRRVLPPQCYPRTSFFFLFCMLPETDSAPTSPRPKQRRGTHVAAVLITASGTEHWLSATPPQTHTTPVPPVRGSMLTATHR